MFLCSALKGLTSDFGINSMQNSVTLSGLKLDENGPEVIAKSASERQRDGLQVSSVNSYLRALRRVLWLASEGERIRTLAQGQVPQRRISNSVTYT